MSSGFATICCSYASKVPGFSPSFVADFDSQLVWIGSKTGPGVGSETGTSVALDIFDATFS